MAAVKSSSPGAYIIGSKLLFLLAISFNALEDQAVKHAFNSLGKCSSNGTLIIPTLDEIKENSRARSAKLRYIKVS